MRGVLEQWNDQTGGALIESLKRAPVRHPQSRQTTRDLTRAGGSGKVACVISTDWARSLACAQDDKPSSRSEMTREHHRR